MIAMLGIIALLALIIAMLALIWVVTEIILLGKGIDGRDSWLG